MNERTTRSRVRNNSHFAHAAFVATFDPKDIGHTLSDHNWVNSMHDEVNWSLDWVGVAVFLPLNNDGIADHMSSRSEVKR
jgi:hypothetical protein